MGRTQQGNNNAYCQDNEISWLDWENADVEFQRFTQDLIALRRAHPSFRRRRWFQGRSIRGTSDLSWFKPDGTEMDDEDWKTDYLRAVGFFLNGEAIPDRDDRGQRVVDNSFFLALNAHDEPIAWTIPKEFGDEWCVVVDTADRLSAEPLASSQELTIEARAFVVLARAGADSSPE